MGVSNPLGAEGRGERNGSSSTGQEGVKLGGGGGGGGRRKKESLIWERGGGGGGKSNLVRSFVRRGEVVVSDIGERGRKCVFLSCSIGRCQGVRLPQKQFAFPPENRIGIYLKCERNTPYIFICEFATSPFYGASLFWDGERERAIKPFHATPTAEQDVSACF